MEKPDHINRGLKDGELVYYLYSGEKRWGIVTTPTKDLVNKYITKEVLKIKQEVVFCLWSRRQWYGWENAHSIFREDGSSVLAPKISTCVEKNNDNRETCYACGSKTRPFGAVSNLPPMGRICTKCGK